MVTWAIKTVAGIGDSASPRVVLRPRLCVHHCATQLTDHSHLPQIPERTHFCKSLACFLTIAPLLSRCVVFLSPLCTMTARIDDRLYPRCFVGLRMTSMLTETVHFAVT